MIWLRRRWKRLKRLKISKKRAEFSVPWVFLEIVRRFATICIYFFAVPLAIFLIAKRPLDAALALFAFAATLLFFSRCLFLSNFLNCFFDYLLFLCNHRRYILENKKTLINVYTLIIKLQVETCFNPYDLVVSNRMLCRAELLHLFSWYIHPCRDNRQHPIYPKDIFPALCCSNLSALRRSIFLSP